MSECKSLVVYGAGGGGKSSKGGGATEQPDTLRSIAYAKIIDLIGEGEMYGFADQENPLKCVYFNETPVMSADGTLNFQNVIIDSRVGTQYQSPYPNFNGVDSELGVGFELKDNPYTRTIYNTNITSLSVRVSTPTLQKINQSNSSVEGYRIAYKIELSVDGGPFVEQYNGALDGKTTSKYERSHRIELPPFSTSVTFRVTRLTPPANSAGISDVMVVESYTETVDLKLRMPMSATVAVEIEAQQFPNIPSRAYRWKGLLIKVPTNYNPTTREYTGIWDGTFKVAYSDNPAWHFYDMILNDRYGLGDRVSPAMVDKWNLYRIARYCDELVPDGYGGFEPRFRSNLYLQEANEAYKVMQDMATIFRGILYAANAQVMASADIPEDPTYIFNQTNVIDGEFVYSGSGAKARHTVALVSWSDLSDFGRAKIEYVDDPESVKRFGVQTVEVTAMGCFSRGQARRMGKHILATERYESELVAFSVGLDGEYFPGPGSVIRIADPLRAGKRTGGRIVTATVNSITVDMADQPNIGDNVTCILPDGSVETRTIQTINERTFTFTAPFTTAPQDHSVWIIESNELYAQTYRVLSIVDGNEPGQYAITALKHTPGRYALIEQGIKFEENPISLIANRELAAPTGITITARDVADENTATKVVAIAWNMVAGATGYDLRWRVNQGEWVEAGQVFGTYYEIKNALPGNYEVDIRAFNQIAKSPAAGNLGVVTPVATAPGYVGTINENISGALGAAQNAQETADLAKALADGAITSYFQATPPTGLGVADVGDLWYNSSEGNKPYRWSGSSWVDASDTAIATAIAAAATAQSTADGKIKTFAQGTMPTAVSVGDLWINTANANKLFRWTGGAWEELRDTGIAAAITAAQNAQAAADGKIDSFWQATPPVGASEGDIWFNTAQGNKIYRWMSGSWVDASDDDMAAALAAASTAQATADGKVRTFFQTTTPTATGLGDLWFNTSPNVRKLFRWNGSNWNDSVGDVTLDQLGGNGINLLPDQYSTFEQANLPGDIYHGGSGAFYRHTDGAISRGIILAPNTTVFLGNFNMKLAPGKTYIVSASIYASGAPNSVGFLIHSNGDVYTGLTPANHSVNTGWARYSGRVTIPAGSYDQHLVLQNFGPYNAVFDGIMVEEAIGNLNKPSQYARGSTIGLTLSAIIAAQDARTVADGKVDIFRQANPPSSGMALGDYWQDSDDGRWYVWNGASWVESTDNRLPQALQQAIDAGAAASAAQGTANTANNAAGAAQATANSKRTIYYQEAQPASAQVGDMWFQPSTKTTRSWSGSGWSLVSDGAAGTASTIANSNFEAGLAYWVNQGKWVWQNGGGISNSGSILVVDSGNGERVFSESRIAVEPGERLQAQALVVRNQVAADGECYLSVFYYDAAGAAFGYQDKPLQALATAGWTAQKNVVTVPAGAKQAVVSVMITGQAAGGAWRVDNLDLRKLTDKNSVDLGVGKNLVPNSNFGGQSGSVAPWGLNWNPAGATVQFRAHREFWSYNAAPFKAAQSNGRVEFHQDGSSSGNPNVIDYATPRIPIKPNTRYEFHVRAAAYRCQFLAFLVIQKADGSYSTGVDSTASYVENGGGELPGRPQQMGNFFTSPADAAFCQFVLRKTGTNSGSDSVVFIEEPFIGEALPNQTTFSQYSPGPLYSADEVGKGTESSVVAVDDIYDVGFSRRLGLRVTGSRQRVGGPRNLPAALVNGVSAVRTATSLTATSAGAVTVNAFSANLNEEIVNYSAVTNAVTGLAQGTSYVIYCLDPYQDGGTRTWYAATNILAAQQAGVGVVIAGNVTIPTSGSSGGGGGGSGGLDCVDYDTVLPDGRYLRDLKPGDRAWCINVATATMSLQPLLAMGEGEVECYRLRTPEGHSVIQSKDTPMDLPDRTVCWTPDMLGKQVWIPGKLSVVSELEYLGVRRVLKPNFGNRMFFAGEHADGTIATHNVLYKP